MKFKNENLCPKCYTPNATQGGFTLLETIVAIGVLSVVIIGPLTFASKSASLGLTSQNQLVAFYLAQEGVEYVRNKRDSNFLNGDDWMNGLGNCMETNPNGCYVDVFSGNDPLDCGVNCPVIKYDSSNERYSYQVGSNTVFARVIKIKEIAGSGKEAEISSTITWRERFGVKSFTLEENIFDWR